MGIVGKQAPWMVHLAKPEASCLPIHFSAMADLDDPDDTPIVVNAVDDPVIPLANPVPVLAR